jgi:hypothetical protein
VSVACNIYQQVTGITLAQIGQAIETQLQEYQEKLSIPGPEQTYTVVRGGFDLVKAFFAIQQGLSSISHWAQNGAFWLGRMRTLLKNFKNPDFHATFKQLSSAQKKSFLEDFETAGPDVWKQLDGEPGMVGAWEVLATSSDNAIRRLRTEVPSLSRFTDDFGGSPAAIAQLQTSPSLLRTWQQSGPVFNRYYPGSGSWPVIQVDDAFKASVRAQYGDGIGDLVDAVDNLNISNNAAVGGGAYHPSLPSPSTDPITAVNFLSGEVIPGGIADNFIDNLHPILKERVDYLEFLKTNSLIDAPAASIDAAGRFGTHAEFRVLDRAIKDLEALEGLPSGTLPVERLGEFTVFVKAKSGPNGLSNTNPPRCVCCWHGTHGINVVGNE